MSDAVVNLGITLVSAGLIVVIMQYLHNKKIKEAEEIYNIKMKALEDNRNGSSVRGRRIKQKE